MGRCEVDHKQRIEFGDFQTPVELASKCCRIAGEQFGDVQVVVEPTCGEGAFLVAAASEFPTAELLGYEINDRYRHAAMEAMRLSLSARQAPRKALSSKRRYRIMQRDFFQCDWNSDRRNHSGAVLFLGNPPWVTNSKLGVLNGQNLPRKSNVDLESGIDAITGNSNFDIAESMLMSLLGAMQPDVDALAMLIKTSTARKVLARAWRTNQRFSFISIRRFDAKKYFGVNVDACLLLLKTTNHQTQTQICYGSTCLQQPASSIAFGWFDGRIVADPIAAAATSHLSAAGKVADQLTWRSGIKHDLAGVLELTIDDGQLETRAGDVIDIEPDLLYPLAKGSDVANGQADCRRCRILITQRTMSEATEELANTHPKTWRYLQANAERFAARKSSIYRGRDRYALFGIGPYTFAPWKVAICGFYKRLSFTLIGPVEGRPVVVDDTCYFLPLRTRSQATLVQQLLESSLAEKYFQSRVFWDAKRPITAKLLRGLSLSVLAEELGQMRQWDQHFDPKFVLF